MRAVIINAVGIVVDIVDLTGKTIDLDGRAARGPASYRIERRVAGDDPEGEPPPPSFEEVAYEAVITAPDGCMLIASDLAGLGWIHSGETFVKPQLDLEQERVAKLAQVNAHAATILAAGAPAPGGLRVALSDASRADLTAMAATAIAAVSGALSWPESYARGWIAVENIRVPLPTAADGLGFADAVGTYYAQVVQNRRDLKDALLAAEDPAALAAVDIDAGWPAA